MEKTAVMAYEAIMEFQSEKHLKTTDEEAALQLDHNDKSLFVFSNFSTPAFHHCKKVVWCWTSSALTPAAPTSLWGPL
uniref:DNA topoisomerase 2-binding protein 1-A-like isoform X3 n=1 Tax=Oncorhynchus gorbuscha TaxID=8017 RepID=UPI001EAEFA19|nr:DNA topoisomerase 2-binding protein 1-A-like isoform X3 [Oncorhynchus gorbuscha]